MRKINLPEPQPWGASDKRDAPKKGVGLPEYVPWAGSQKVSANGKVVSLPEYQPWAPTEQKEVQRTQPALEQTTWQQSERKEDARRESPKLAVTEWQDLPGILPPIAQKIFKGENKLDRFSIEDTFATETKNLSSRAFPALSVRPGFTALGPSLTARVLGLGAWKDAELQAVANSRWHKWNGSAWSELASGLSASAAWSFCNFKGASSDFNLIASNGVDAIKTYNGVAVSNLSGAPAGGNYIDTHDNRLYVAVKNMVQFSALNIATDWTDTDPYTGSGTIRINDASGKDIIGLKAGSEHLLTFFPNSCYELYGTGPDDMRMMPVANDIGLLSNRCVVSVAGVLYWMDGNRIYRYTGGSRPQSDFSLPIQDYIEKINKAHTAKCSAGTDGKRVYFSFPSGSATEPDTTLEYDPEFSGVWYVWKDFSPLAYAKIGNDLHFGDSAGNVRKLGGTTDNGTAIAWKWVSVPFGSRIGAQNVRWYRMYLIVDLPAGSTCNVYLSASDQGDSDWMLAKTITAASGVQKRKIIIPVETVANADWVRVKFEGTGPVYIGEFDRTMREMPLD